MFIRDGHMAESGGGSRTADKKLTHQAVVHTTISARESCNIKCRVVKHAVGAEVWLHSISTATLDRRVTLLENLQEYRMKELHHEHRYNSHSKASALTVKRLRIK